MRTLTRRFAVILTISALSVAAGSAVACGGGGGGFKFGGSHRGGGFGISYGHNNYNHHHHKVYVKKVYTPVVVYDKCYHPYYSTCFVHPGDTWYTISRRCYGHSHLWKHIAIYNQIGFGSPLVAGTPLRLPVVNGNGTLAVSTAPASAPFAAQGLPAGPQGGSIAPQGMQFGAQGAPSQPNSGSFAPQGQPMGPNGQSFAPQGQPMGPNGQSFAPQGQPTGPNGQSFAPQGQPTAPQGPTNMPNSVPSDRSVSSPSSDATPATPAANIRVATEEKEEKSLPTVTIGSTLLLDGQLLGEAKGIVRLRISGMALPVEILEWKISSATIRLPEMDLARAMKAEIEVLRADGSLASKSAVELTPAATRLALGN